MSSVWYLPTTDERNNPLVVKVRVIGEREGWRMVRQFGSHEDVIVHVRHITQNWLSAWMKAKSISRLRRQRNVVRDSGGRGKAHVKCTRLTEVETGKTSSSR